MKSDCTFRFIEVQVWCAALVHVNGSQGRICISFFDQDDIYIIYRIISYNTIPYRIYHTISCIISSYIISHHISYPISYHISYRVTCQMWHVTSYHIISSCHIIYHSYHIIYIISNHARKSIALSKFSDFARLSHWRMTGYSHEQNMRHLWDDTDRANRTAGTKFRPSATWSTQTVLHVLV
jgi:hypothetical protein